MERVAWKRVPAGQLWDFSGMAFVSRSAVSTDYGLLNSKLAAIAFAFTAPSTVSLYSSLKAGHLNHRHKTKTYQSFRTLLIVSALVSFALILPLAFFGSAPFSAVSPSHEIFSFCSTASSPRRIMPKCPQDQYELSYMRQPLS